MRVIGVDIGGTTIKLGIVDAASATVSEHVSFPTPQGGAEEVARADGP